MRTMIKGAHAGKRGLCRRLAVAVCLLFFFSQALSAAGAAVRPCPPATAAAGHGQAAHGEGCCCCKNVNTAQAAPCGLQCKCGAEDGKIPLVSGPGVQGPAPGPGPAHAAPGAPSLRHENLRNTLQARETIYLINLNLLC